LSFFVSGALTLCSLAPTLEVLRVALTGDRAGWLALTHSDGEGEGAGESAALGAGAAGGGGGLSLGYGVSAGLASPRHICIFFG
jgi:hypothetical protein